MTSETRTWAEMIVATALDQRDVKPMFELAARGGVDLEELYRVVNAAFEAVNVLLGAVSEPEELLSVDDFAELARLGISGD